MRQTFDFSEEAWERLDRLAIAIDAKGYADVIRNALRVYEWALEEIKNGHEIAAVDPQTGRAVVLTDPLGSRPDRV